MKKLLLSTALVFAASAASAGSLADPVVQAEPTVVASVVSWAGFYAGGLAGMGTGKVGNAGEMDSDLPSFDVTRYGAFAGYNYAFGNGLVAGAEIAYSMGDWAQDGTTTTYLDLKGRIGFELDRALIYVSGGYTLGTLTYEDETFRDGAGWNAGVGIDYLVTDGVFLGIEYLYRDVTDYDGGLGEDQEGTILARVGIKF